jgi:hypothetical protein
LRASSTHAEAIVQSAAFQTGRPAPHGPPSPRPNKGRRGAGGRPHEKDFDLLKSCFHPDARLEFGFFGGTLDDFLAGAREQLPHFVGTTHNTGNQLVEVAGDKAWAEHYTVATHRIAADDLGPERDFVTSVRYADLLECRDGDWRIVRRELILDWVRSDPVVVIEPRPEVQAGRRDRGDPSYMGDRR